MPEDTKYIVNQSQLTAIGTAIREKLNEQTTYTVDEMPGKIEDISGGGGDGVEIENPIFTINYIEHNFSRPHGLNLVFEEMSPNFAIENNFLTTSPKITSGTGTLQLYVLDTTEEFLLIFKNRIVNISASNEVNSELLENEEGMYAIGTQHPTQNSSITIEYTLSELD